MYATEIITSELLAWSDEIVMFNISDHTENIPHPGKHALVVDLIIDGCRLPRVLMDAGDGLNIIFPDTLSKMGVSLSSLQGSDASFHGFVRGQLVLPLERIELGVVFGDEDKFWTERLKCEVAPFHSGYNAIFGRPTYVKFMAVPSYLYLQLKMLGPNGTITAHGSPERAFEAEVANVELAEAALASAELKRIKRSIDP